MELKPKGIHVCAVQPSATKSDFMERAQFQGQDEKQAQEYRQQMNNLLATSLSSQSEDVAQAIWDALRYQKAEIVVGSGTIFSTAYRLFPGFIEWIMQQSNQKSL